MLADEHTWTASGSVSDPQSQEATGQLAVKELFATKAKSDVDYVLRRALDAMADNIYDPKGTLIVFNPLNWERSNLVEFDLAKGLELVDLNTKLVVPFQVLSTGESIDTFVSWPNMCLR